MATITEIRQRIRDAKDQLEALEIGLEIEERLEIERMIAAGEIPAIGAKVTVKHYPHLRDKEVYIKSYDFVHLGEVSELFAYVTDELPVQLHAPIGVRVRVLAIMEAHGYRAGRGA